MLRIGLTGGIGSGKTTVCRLFEKLGVPVIDADLIGHELVEPGEPLLEQIREAFGDDLIRSDGSLDRALLRARAFADDASRERLEAIMHPAILAEMQRRTSLLNTDYCVLCIPLLFETGQQQLVDRVVVVDVEETTQRQRVRARDGRSDEEIDAIMAAQINRSMRLAQADDVIDNEGGHTALEAQVKNLHTLYTKLAQSGK